MNQTIHLTTNEAGTDVPRSPLEKEKELHKPSEKGAVALSEGVCGKEQLAGYCQIKTRAEALPPEEGAEGIKGKISDKEESEECIKEKLRGGKKRS